MTNEKAGAPTPACEEVTVGMNTHSVAQPEPDHVAIALRIANFIWLAVNLPKGAK